MKIITKLLVIFFILLNGGCSVFFPKYEKPKVDIPAEWRTKDPKSKILGSNLSEIKWWTSFNDPQLVSLINCALEKNSDLQIGYGNVKQAQAALMKTMYGWLPSVGGGAAGALGNLTNLNITNPQSPVQLSRVIFSEKVWPYNAYMSGFVPSYSLNLFSQINQVNMSKYNLESKIETYHAVRLAIISQTAASYFTLLGLKKELYLHNQLLKDLTDIKKYSNFQYNSGSVSLMKLNSIDQQIATLKANVPKIKDGITHAENAINVLTSHRPSSINIKRDFDAIKTDKIIPANLPAKLLQQRPDIKMAEYQLRMYNSAVGTAASQLFPTVDLAGFLGNAALNISTTFTFYTNILHSQAVAIAPIFHPKIWAYIKRAKAIRYMAVHNYISKVNKALAEVDNGFSTHLSVNQSYFEKQIALDKSRDQRRLAFTKYNAGALSYVDALTFKLNEDKAKLDLNKYKMQQMASIVNLYQVLGGGSLEDKNTEKKLHSPEIKEWLPHNILRSKV